MPRELFSQSGPWRPAVVARLARTLGITKYILRLASPLSTLMLSPTRNGIALRFARQYAMPQTSPCTFCPATKFICFWGELRPYAPWRRWVLLACSVLLTILFGGIIWFFTEKLNWILWLISVPMFLISLLNRPGF